MEGVTAYAIRRLLVAAPVLLLALTAVFVLVRLVPGDAASVSLGDQGSAAALAALKRELGLDRPVLHQYATFVAGALSGDLGRSLHTGQPVIQEVLRALPATIELAGAGIAIGIVLGLPLGIAGALERNRWIDEVLRVVTLAGLSLPAFVSGILLLIVFAIHLGWFPILSQDRGSVGIKDRLHALALPALNLGLIIAAYMMQVTRAAMLGVLAEDYIRTARAKGLSRPRLVVTHAFRNCLILILTVVGLYFGALLGNSVLTEMIFDRPGLGSLIVDAVNARDYPLLQGLMVSWPS